MTNDGREREKEEVDTILGKEDDGWITGSHDSFRGYGAIFVM